MASIALGHQDIGGVEVLKVKLRFCSRIEDFVSRTPYFSFGGPTSVTKNRDKNNNGHKIMEARYCAILFAVKAMFSPLMLAHCPSKILGLLPPSSEAEAKSNILGAA